MAGLVKTGIKMGIVAAVGTLVQHLLSKKQKSNAETQGAPVFSSGVVRNAGAEAQTNMDKGNWDKVDEQVDESFPASDPPSTY